MFEEWETYTILISFVLTDYQTSLRLIEVLSLSTIFGHTSLKDWEFRCATRPLTILRQTDKTESVNKVMEQYLRSFISYQQDDWSD